jgi:hypothetical protein
MCSKSVKKKRKKKHSNSPLLLAPSDDALGALPIRHVHPAGCPAFPPRDPCAGAAAPGDRPTLHVTREATKTMVIP